MQTAPRVFVCALPSCGAACGADFTRGGCAAARYCSNQCCEEHWSEHRDACTAELRARVRAGGGELGSAATVLEARLAGPQRPLRSARRLTRCQGDSDDETIAAISEFASLRQGQGKLGEAETLRREALERWQRTQGRRSPNALTALCNLGGGLLREQGRLAEAAPLLYESFEQSHDVFGYAHTRTLVCYNQLGALLLDQRKPHDAELVYRRGVVTARGAPLEGDNRTKLILISGLATSLQAQGRLEEAQPLFLECLDASRRTLGSRHPDSLTAISNYALLLMDRGRLGEAEALMREAVGTGRDVQPGHPSTMRSIGNLATVLVAQGGRLDQAEVMREAHAGFLASLGAAHATTCEICHCRGRGSGSGGGAGRPWPPPVAA